jgi:aminoglycoside phosphotransferase
MDIEEVLQDNPNRKVVRIGDTVRRPTHPWTPTIHALLTYLEQVGFTYSPRVLGFDDQGREMLTYIEGESGADGWAKVVDERGLDAFARLLREYHEVIAGFHPADHAVWASGATAPLGSSIICHGDFGPWNVVWHDLKPVGLIDWDYARPAPSSFDVAYALEYVAPFRDDAQCLRWLRYSTAPDRSSRLRRFIEAYGEDPSID